MKWDEVFTSPYLCADWGRVCLGCWYRKVKIRRAGQSSTFLPFHLFSLCFIDRLIPIFVLFRSFFHFPLYLSLSSLSLSIFLNFPTTLSLPLSTCLFHPLSSFQSPLTQSLSLSVPASGCLSLSFSSLSPSFSLNLYSLSIKHPIFHSNQLINFIEIFQIRSLFYLAWISLDLILSLPQSHTHPLPEYLGGK